MLPLKFSVPGTILKSALGSYFVFSSGLCLSRSFSALSVDTRILWSTPIWSCSTCLHSSWRDEATRNERRPHQTLLCALIHNRAAEFESRNLQWIVISGIVAMDAREAAGYLGPGLCSDATICITCPCCSVHVSQFPQLPTRKCSLHRTMCRTLTTF